MSKELPNQTVALMSETEFITSTSAWRDASNDTSKDLKHFFIENGQLYNCALFSLPAVESLLSAEGVKKIKAKFCIHEFCGKQTFNIALFAEDSIGARNSAYYRGTPYVRVSENVQQGGKIPDWLAKTWIDNWRLMKDKSSFTAGQLFDTRYGMLEGYNYDMLDILNTLYTAKPVDKVEYLCIHFALHRHYRPGNDDPQAPTSTFNLILQRVLFNNDTSSKEVISDDVFYDISAPCPPY